MVGGWWLLGGGCWVVVGRWWWVGGGGWVLVIVCGSGSAGWEVLVGGWWVLLDGWLVWWCLGGGGWVVVVVVGGGGGGWWWVMVGGHGWWWVVVTPHLHFGSEEGPYLVSRVVPHLRGERTLKTLSNCNGILSKPNVTQLNSPQQKQL